MFTRLLIACLIYGIILSASANETWPSIDTKPKWISGLNDRFEGTSGRYHNAAYKAYFQSYSAGGDYLNYGGLRLRGFQTGGGVVTDENGLPQILYNGELYWNPVTLSQYSLTMYGGLLAGVPNTEDNFRRGIDQLLEIQRPDGGFSYPGMLYGAYFMEDGWYSAMAQGQALSAFSRSLQIEDDPSVREAAMRAFETLMTPISEGGTATTLSDLNPSLDGYVFYAEYPSDPIVYTLNGFMFTLLGIYDWSQMDTAQKGRAEKAFRDGIATLERILPYYDVDGLSTYNAAQYIIEDHFPQAHSVYMGVHVYLLHALNSLVENPVMEHYEQRWDAKLERMNRLLKFTAMKPDRPPPQRAGTTIRYDVKSAGGTGAAKLYRYNVKLGNQWSIIKDWSSDDFVEWTPKESGEYIISFSVKNIDSSKPHDNFRYLPFTVTE